MARTLPGSGLTNSVDPDTASPGDSESQVNLGSSGGVSLDEDFGYVGSNPGAINGTIWNDSDTDGALEGSEAGRYQGHGGSL